ncbi:endoribonuclease MazF [Deinococcus lacus]|uniref:Endoribonuclease MazF n=1 Tax=Deinococcus lacus TaxID=392561 RepID=A0ABW1YDE7_9DEIO
MVGEYVPDAGHLVWLNFTPQAGHEQGGRRPALVLSPAVYNGATGLMQACPVTSRVKGYPFEVALPDDVGVSGVVLADHCRSLDWRSRKVEFIGEAPARVLAEVQGKLGVLLGILGDSAGSTL